MSMRVSSARLEIEEGMSACSSTSMRSVEIMAFDVLLQEN